MAAAIAARRFGVETTLVDEHSILGGQIFKQFAHDFTVTNPSRLSREYRVGRRLIDAAEASGAEILLGTVAWALQGTEVAIYAEGNDVELIKAKRVILATGAHDRPVVFPGWTLPGVMTAGAAQSLVKVQRVVPGRRILMAGSGPLILAFSAMLHRYGANVIAVLEASPAPRASALLRLASAGIGNIDQLRDGAYYMAYLRSKRIPFLYSHTILRAEGEREVERAIITRVDRSWRPIPGTEQRLDVDTVCIGYGLFPSTELSRLSNCQMVYEEDLGGHVPTRDDNLRTSTPGILAVGDGAGVRGSRAAVHEGTLAGLTVAADLGVGHQPARAQAAETRRYLDRLERFRSAMASMYPVGPGAYELASDQTVVCRCEEITLGELDDRIVVDSEDPNCAKAMTRAGMGRCQGRNCARQIAALIARRTGRRIEEVPMVACRPPVKPVPIGAVAWDG